jgi:hypothetical protein
MLAEAFSGASTDRATPVGTAIFRLMRMISLFAAFSFTTMARVAL